MIKEKNMVKQELIKHLAAHAGVTNKQAEAVLNALTSAVLDVVRAGGVLAISDLGKFGTTQRAPKVGRNPKTGETIQISAKCAPKFSSAKALKDAANYQVGAKGHLE